MAGNADRGRDHPRLPRVADPAWDPWGWDPLGVHRTADGTVEVALWAEGADTVEFCVFDDADETRLELPDRRHHIFHGRIDGVPVGARYGFRVHGPWEPERGKRWNPAKLLMDPYARAIDGEFVLDPAVFDHVESDPRTRSTADSAPFVPKSVVVDSAFDWASDALPQTPWHDTVIYETHTRGLTKLHPAVPEHQRGTYAGAAHPAVIEHLLKLGVTTVEFLPVHHFVSEIHLLRSGLTNYWGYNTIGFFAPHARYSSAGSRGQQVDEFKTMVKAYHAAGLEVVIDVVYNHTAEGGVDGPTLSFRGIGNDDYYYLTEDGSDYIDYTGCGNTLDASHPHVLQMILDSLRYWATEMHIDGFRFDLTSTLARSLHEVDMLGSFMSAIQQDPVLRRLKLIAEPWDVGPGGYQVGGFPVLWAEWNDRFRDTTRSYWRGSATLADMGWRLTGSADLYAPDGRRPFSSINFVTAHDGFTLRDLVTYDHKHNDANLEQGRDGTDHNLSANYGVEGETDDPAINALRHRQMRNLLTTCVLASGVPMICGGDEFGRTQFGNNNAYCQDNPISWYDWDWHPWQRNFVDFTASLIHLRQSNPAFRRQHFFAEESDAVSGDVLWWHPDGRRLEHDDWHSPDHRCLGMIIADNPLTDLTTDLKGDTEQVLGRRFLIAMNAQDASVEFHLPGSFASADVVLYTDAVAPQVADGIVHLTGRSTVIVTAA
ncbi:MAG: glycogen debranching protein GlgX [Candidatus Nanopelagicales bacterium]